MVAEVIVGHRLPLGDVECREQAGRADLQYGTELQVPRLLHAPLDPELDKITADARKFRAHQSLRDVEDGRPLARHAVGRRRGLGVRCHGPGLPVAAGS